LSKHNIGKNKKYSGYEAYQYLEPERDYRYFKLRDAIKKEWEYLVPLSKKEEEKIEDFFEKNIIISIHDHPNICPENITQEYEYSSEGRAFMAYEALSFSGLDCVLDGMLNGKARINTKNGWDWLSTIHDLGMRLCDIAHQDFVIHAKTVDDVYEAYETGKLAWVPVLESLSCIENEVDRIDVLYGLGIRSSGLTYSNSNFLGGGLDERRDAGLTDFGYDCIKRMNKLGMIIDVAHSGYQTSLDTIMESDKPVMISHAAAQSLVPWRRFFPDEVLFALAKKNGLLGVVAAGYGIRTEKNPSGDIYGFMEHLEYCIDLIGIDHVGFGPDLMYGDHTLLYRYKPEMLRNYGLGSYDRPGSTAFDMASTGKDIDYVKGCENSTECTLNIARWLVKNGYSEREMAKIMGGNALRLFKKNW
jgi:membrane dipeptidase